MYSDYRSAPEHTRTSLHFSNSQPQSMHSRGALPRTPALSDIPGRTHNAGYLLLHPPLSPALLAGVSAEAAAVLRGARSDPATQDSTLSRRTAAVCSSTDLAPALPLTPLPPHGRGVL